MQNTLKNLSNEAVVTKLEHLVQIEKRTTAEVVEYIKEVNRRKIYLELGYTSLFSYLTQSLGYTPASAQRRIEAARALEAHPEIKEHIQTGSLNLTQISIVAQSLRQKKLEAPNEIIAESEAKEILNRVKDLDLTQTQKVVSQALNLEIQTFEKKRVQQDDSVRVELTLSREQVQDLERVKELISHTHVNPSLSELFGFLASEFLKRRDPLKKPVTSESEAAAGRKSLKAPRSKKSNKPSSAEKTNINPPLEPLSTVSNTCIGSFPIDLSTHESAKPTVVSARVRRYVFQKFQSCQWLHDGKMCGSKFQLQVEHKQSVWAGGTNEIPNLTLLCSTHNRMKYRKESGITPKR